MSNPIILAMTAHASCNRLVSGGQYLLLNILLLIYNSMLLFSILNIYEDFGIIMLFFVALSLMEILSEGVQVL